MSPLRLFITLNVTTDPIIGRDDVKVVTLYDQIVILSFSCSTKLEGNWPLVNYFGGVC